MSDLVKYKKDGQIVTIMLANPPVNSVSTKVLTAVNAAFDRVWPESETARARMELVRRLRLTSMLPRIRNTPDGPDDDEEDRLRSE